MKTLRDLMAEYDANGFVITDRRQGSGGSCWMAWNDKEAAEYGSLEMTEVSYSAPVWDDADPLDFTWSDGTIHSYTCAQIASDACDDYQPADKVLISAIISNSSNDYEYRIIF
jgi:hypothetical protein